MSGRKQKFLDLCQNFGSIVNKIREQIYSNVHGILSFCYFKRSIENVPNRINS